MQLEQLLFRFVPAAEAHKLLLYGGVKSGLLSQAKRLTEEFACGVLPGTLACQSGATNVEHAVGEIELFPLSSLVLPFVALFMLLKRGTETVSGSYN